MINDYVISIKNRFSFIIIGMPSICFAYNEAARRLRALNIDEKDIINIRSILL